MSRQYVKVPIVMQMEAVECGAASLAMMLAYYDRWVPLEQVRAECGISRDGSNAKNIILAARRYGLEADGYSITAASLQQQGTFPCILHWNFNHFVVLCGFKGNRAVINDPENGLVELTMDEFEQSFTGICLTMKPGENFLREGHKKNVLPFIQKRMRGMKSAFIFSLMIGVLIALCSMLQPMITRVFMDQVLDGSSKDWMKPVIFLAASITAIQIILLFLQRIAILKIQGKFAVMTNSRFLWHVIRLPMEFFRQRKSGDLLMRQNANEQVSQSIFTQLAPIVIHFCTLIFYLVVMIRYSYLLTLVGVGTILVSVALAGLISKKRIAITRVQMRNKEALYSAAVSGIEMIETIKASGCENSFFGRWSGLQASECRQDVRYVKLNAYLGMLPEFLHQVTVISILVLGAYLVMCGDMTKGMLIAFQSLFLAFMEPAKALITSGQELQEMRSDMERIEDIMDYQEEQVFKQSEDGGILTGEITLSHVTFGYSRLAKPLIRDFSLSIKPGSTIAIVGSSGCGKSTIAKLVTGLYQPWEGEILFDGKRHQEISQEAFRASVAMVDQDITLFSDTIANNLKMWDDTIENYGMLLGARDAQIHEEIMKRPGGYQYEIQEGGKNFSGGQRQRMELARVLALDPPIIILDEATSALDAKTENEVMREIKKRGVTCIIISHRLSIIRDCDEILVMEQGEVVERGKHEELYAANGQYTRLVMDE